MTRTTGLSSWLVQSTTRLRSRVCSPAPSRSISRQSSSLQKPFSAARLQRHQQRSKYLCIYERARTISSTAHRRHGHLDTPKPGEELHVSFIDQQGEKHDFEVAAGANLLDIAQAKDLEMEGACGGSCACSTCHVIVEDSDYYDKMAEPDDDENDMLDLAFGLTETSRLGCQVNMSKELDGLVVRLPSMTRNLQKSDFEKK